MSGSLRQLGRKLEEMTWHNSADEIEEIERRPGDLRLLPADFKKQPPRAAFLAALAIELAA